MDPKTLDCVRKKVSYKTNLLFPFKYLSRDINFHFEDEIEKNILNKSFRIGFIEKIHKKYNISKGKIITENECGVKYTVEVLLDVINPRIGDVFPCIIKKITKVGIFASNGPIDVFISFQNLKQDMNYNRNDIITIEVLEVEYERNRSYLQVLGNII